MKYTLSLLVLFKFTLGFSQFSFDSSGLKNFHNTLIDYSLSQYSETNPIQYSQLGFNEIPDAIDSLEKAGYRLQFVHAVESNYDHYFKRDTSNAINISKDSTILKFFSELSRSCTDGIYYAYSIGDNYYIISGSRPTGVVNKLEFYLIKEEELH